VDSPFKKENKFSGLGNMANILIIDDEEGMCKYLESAIIKNGHKVNYALTIKDGCQRVSSNYYDVVFLDVHLPDGNGLDHLKMITSTPSNPEVIIITGERDPDAAEIAIKNGVWDYLKKPFSIDNITLQLIRVLQYREEKNAAKVTHVLKREGIIGESPQIKDCLKLVAESSLSDINVLITGETGTGKERFASVIHENSRRAKGNFVIVDCAALPETLVESTIFGHVKGAFTGADRDHEGLIKQADGGTLFLDEIGELPMSIQKTFLRVLQERSFRPVGSKKEVQSDFRLIAATNRDLNWMIKNSAFREDLFFRIKSMTISLPPLRDRSLDIKELTINTILKICERDGIDVKGFSPELIKMLEAYPWPGNVRELINCIEWVINKAHHEPTLFPKHLPDQIRISIVRSSLGAPVSKGNNASHGKKKLFTDSFPKMKDFRDKIIAETEKDYLDELIAFTKGNIHEACSLSGLGRARLYGLMKNYGISKTPKPIFTVPRF
jgi:two-component system NtrC family response regulator